MRIASEMLRVKLLDKLHVAVLMQVLREVRKHTQPHHTSMPWVGPVPLCACFPRLQLEGTWRFTRLLRVQRVNTHEVLKTIPETVPTQVGQAPLSAPLLAVLSVLPDVRELRNWEGPMATSHCSHSASAATRWDDFLLHSFSWLILSYLVLGSSESLFPQKDNPDKSFYTELDSPMLRDSTSSRMLLVSILWLPLV